MKYSFTRVVVACIYLMAFGNKIICLRYKYIERLDAKSYAAVYANLSKCKYPSPYLKGHQRVKETILGDRSKVTSLIDIRSGGWSRPDNCRPLPPVAIIVPYRVRNDSNVEYFIQYMHPFLERQLLAYRIFLVEQDDKKPFNRALLLNIGFDEAMKFNDYKCIIFHDLELLPTNDKCTYYCVPGLPRGRVNDWMGGVLVLKTSEVRKVNGWSNFYWGWGSEDDDMRFRIDMTLKFSGNTRVATYYHLSHFKNESHDLLSVNRQLNKLSDILRAGNDGLATLQKTGYKIKGIVEFKLYTKITVDFTDVMNILSFKKNALICNNVSNFKPPPIHAALFDEYCKQIENDRILKQKAVKWNKRWWLFKQAFS